MEAVVQTVDGTRLQIGTSLAELVEARHMLEQQVIAEQHLAVEI